MPTKVATSSQIETTAARGTRHVSRRIVVDHFNRVVTVQTANLHDGGQGEREHWVIGGDLVSLALLHSSIGLYMEVQSIGVGYGVHGRKRIGHCFDRGFLL